MTELEKFIKQAKEMCEKDKDAIEMVEIKIFDVYARTAFPTTIKMLKLIKGVLEYYNGLVDTGAGISHRTLAKLEKLAKEANG